MPKCTLQIEWEGYQTEDESNYWGTVKFPAPHLGEGTVFTRDYDQTFETMIFDQMAEDIRKYLNNPIKTIQSFVTPKSAPEIYILELEYEMRQYERSQKEHEQGIAKAREAIEKRKKTIEEMKKQYGIKED